MIKYFNAKVLTTYLFTLVLFFTFSPLTAQNTNLPPYLNPEYGSDSISRVKCANNLSTLVEFMKIDLPEYALPAWKILFDDYPGSSKNIYISGVKIYQYLYSKASDSFRKESLFDSLMLIYDRRIEYFGEEAIVLGRKGVDIIRYNQEAYQEAYTAFSRSAELSQTGTSLNVVTGLIQTSSVMYKNELINTHTFLSHYYTSKDILKHKRALGKSIPSIRRADMMVDKILEETKINDCKDLETFFIEKISENESDEDILKLSIDMLTASGCDNTQFFADSNEKLMKLSPNADLAYEVAKYNLKNQNYPKAAEFLKLAIENEKKLSQKALYQHQLAILLLVKLSDPKEARYYGLLATESNPGWGEPFLVVASATIEGVKTCNVEAFEKQAIYWLAVDYCNKAKSVDPKVSKKADDLISQYTSNFPNVEEIFFRSLKEGDEYSFNCWFEETTRVKSR